MSAYVIYLGDVLDEAGYRHIGNQRGVTVASSDQLGLPA